MKSQPWVTSPLPVHHLVNRINGLRGSHDATALWYDSDLLPHTWFILPILQFPPSRSHSGLLLFFLPTSGFLSANSPRHNQDCTTVSRIIAITTPRYRHLSWFPDGFSSSYLSLCHPASAYSEQPVTRALLSFKPPVVS